MVWEKINSNTWYIILSSMQNDLVGIQTPLPL